MSDENLMDLVPAIVRLFDDNLRRGDDVKGWGQFIAAESHADQIGLYGTSAGLLVKTIANPAAHIEDGVIAYFKREWESRDDPASKYFHQNIRLAFFLLSLASTAEVPLVAIRAQATDELIARQLPDGGWGDWWLSSNENDTSARLETTAWAILALTRLNDPRHSERLRKSGLFLQKNLVGQANLEKVDPILLSAIIRSLEPRDVDKRINTAAINLLRRSRPQNDVQIYFFDYLVGAKTRRRVKRDFLCVPAFLPHSLLSSSVQLDARMSLASLAVEFAHNRTIEHLKSLAKDLPFKNPGSKFPATVDQALLAVSLEVASKRKVRFSGVLRFLRWAQNQIRTNSIIRVFLPIIAVTLLAAAAKDPNLLWQTYVRMSAFHANEFRAWIEEYSSLIQISALGISFFVGNPLIMNIKTFIQSKLRL